MQIYFDAPEFDSQLLRTLSYTYYQGADLGDCLATVKHIKERDFQSWHEKWFQTAERIYKGAEKALAEGHKISAKEAFLRASNYYRTSFFFLYDFPVDPLLYEAYEKHCLAFSKAISLFSTHVEPIQIPYENTSLPGYFYQTDDPTSTKPVVIISNGYDGTHQEGYFIAGAAALARNYHVLCFDGPGQGEMLIKKNFYMRYDWEKVITPAVDYLLSRADVDPKRIALIGPSWGGYLAPRAAAFEHRIAALVANPGQFDAMNSIRRAFPHIDELLTNDPEHLLGRYLSQAMLNPLFAAKIRAKMWIHGVESPVELFRIWQSYTLSSVVKQIKCPTLVMDAENEPLSTGQAKVLFEQLSCPKDYILFTAKEGAGEHCQAGALSYANERLFDWLDKVFLAFSPLRKDSEITEKVNEIKER